MRTFASWLLNFSIRLTNEYVHQIAQIVHAEGAELISVLSRHLPIKHISLQEPDIENTIRELRELYLHGMAQLSQLPN